MSESQQVEQIELQTNRNTFRMRLALLVVAVVLICQSLFISRYGQPYPAIVMPGFHGSGGYQAGQVELHRFEAVFISGEQEFTFSPQVLLEEFPDSLHGRIASSSLRPTEKSVKETSRKPAISRWGNQLFPGFAARKSSRTTTENVASLRQWLQHRANSLLSDQKVSRVEIRWFQETITVEQGELKIQREPTERLIVLLEGAST